MRGQMLETGAVADRGHQHGGGQRLGLAERRVTLDHRHRGAGADLEVTAVVGGGGRTAGQQQDDLDRRRHDRAGRDLDHRAALQEGGVQRQHGLDGAELLRAREPGVEVARRQRVEHRRHRHAGRERRQVGELGAERAVEYDDAGRARHDVGCEVLARPGDRRLVGGRGRRQGLADEAAQIGVVPAFDPAAGQAGLAEEREGLVPPWRGGIGGAEGAELLAEHALGVVFAADEGSHGSRPQAAASAT